MDENRVKILFEDLSYSSKYEFLEIGKNDAELHDIAIRKGIQLPSKDLAIFKGRYAFVDKENKNRCTLPKKEVKKALKTLTGKAIDKDHLRQATIGFWLDSELEDDEIISYGAFWKGNFPEDFGEIQKRMSEGKLKISFEAWGDRVFKEDKSYDLTNIEFAGGALLFDSEPAFQDAEVLEMSHKVLEFAKVIEDGTIKMDNALPKTVKAPDHVELRCKRCGAEFDPHGDSRYTRESEDLCPVCDWQVNELQENEDLYEVLRYAYENIEGSSLIDEDGKEITNAKQLTSKERKAIPSEKFAVLKTVKNKGTGTPKEIRMFPIHDPAHVRNALARLPQATATLKKLGISPETVERKILARARELKMADLLKRHSKGGIEVDELLKKYGKSSVEELATWLTTEYEALKTVLASKDSEISALKTEKETLVKTAEDSKIMIENSKIELEKIQVEAKTIKEQLDARLAAEKAAFIKTRRDELGEEFSKDLTDEDISNDLKFENAKLKKELAIAKGTVKAPEKATTGLEAGAQIKDKDNPVFKKQEKIQKQAFQEEIVKG